MAQSDIIGNLKLFGQNAYTPVCNFAFRCAIESADGQIFYGVNWELPDFKVGCCAEVAALSDMISRQGASHISSVWLMADQEEDEKVFNNCPCGVCRQHLMEYATPQSQLHLVSPSGRVVESLPLLSLMPRPFNYRSYLPGVETLLSKGAKPASPQDFPLGEQHIQAYMKTLLGNSFCPAFKKHEACVLVMSDGKLVGGCSFSTASLKGSNSALKSAISRKITYFGNAPVSCVYASPGAFQLSGDDKDILRHFNLPDVRTIGGEA